MFLSKFQKANKVFTDRIEPKIYYEEQVQQLKIRADYKKITCFYGIGGIGKTRFLKEIKYQEEKKDDIVFLQVNFDAYELDSPVKIIMNLRKQLNGIDFIFFDYALVQYFYKNGLPTKDILDRFKDMKSSINDALKTASDTTAAEFIPYYSLAKKIIEGAKHVQKYIKYKKYEDDFKAIDGLSANEIYKLLPKMLADGINEANKKVIFFLDDFESMTRRIKDMSISDDALRWLIDIYVGLCSILLVVAARDKLTLDQKYPFLSKDISQYYLDKLSGNDARQFLETIPIKEESIIERILELAQGIPLFLDMCADIYVNTDEFDFNHLSIREIIDRYLRHLEPHEQDLVLYLSYLNTFEKQFVSFLAKEKNIPLSDLYIDQFLELSLFFDANHYKKIDASINAHIFDSGMNRHVSGLRNVIEKYLSESISIDHEDYIHYFNQLISLSSTQENQLSLTEVEFLVYIISRLVDRGYANQIETAITNAYQVNASFYPIYSYFFIVKYRRTGEFTQAKQLYDTNETTRPNGFDSTIFGKFKESYTFTYIQVLHLLGHYDQAMNGYKSIINDLEFSKSMGMPFDQRVYHLAKIKYGDIMFLKGNFLTAMEYVNQLKLTDIPESENRMEVLRVKAHILRFNYRFDEAIRIYNYILNNESDRDIKIKGNVYTNLAESYVFTDPHTSLDYVEKSIEINTAIHSKVEVGKALAAKAIALANLNRYKESLTEAEQAIEIQMKTGYQAGILFAKIARLYCLSRMENEKTSSTLFLIEEIKAIMDKIGVYQYLGLLLNHIYGEDIIPLDSVQWIDIESTKNTMDRYIKR